MIATAAAGCYLALAGLLAGAMEHDPFTGPVEVVRYGFDSEEELDLLPGLWQPRGWTRRRGPRFPSYVVTGIDREHGFNGGRSLKFEVNGGQAVCYSPPVHVDSLHSYVFEGYIRTQRLKHDAALLSVSLLNHKRQRVQRFLGTPVSGTHRGWVRVRIGPIEPREDVRFVVIGCHLANGEKLDIEGDVWFDELFLGKLPQLSLAGKFQTYFKQRTAPIEIAANVSGLDLDRLCSFSVDEAPEIVAALDVGAIAEGLKQKLAGHGHSLSDRAGVKSQRDGGWLLIDGERSFFIARQAAQTLAVYDARSPYRLHFRIRDSAGNIVDETAFPLEAAPPWQEDVDELRKPKTWRLDAKDYGFYRVQLMLERDGVVVMENESSFAVIEMTEQPPHGEFGWSIDTVDYRLSPRELADIAAQAGINWLKHPVWKPASADKPQDAANVAELFDRLAHRGVTTVGVLGEPPPEIRGKFARDWTGVSEVFALPRSSWAAWLEPVIARYSSNVHHWQLGGDEDASFVGMSALPQTLLDVKSEFDRIGRNTQIGVRWNWKTPLPSRAQLPQTFLAFDDKNPDRDEDDVDEPPRPMSPAQLIARLKGTPRGDFPRWVQLQPQTSGRSPQESGAELVKRMVAARIGGADAIFASNVFHPQYGLLHPHGSPTALFLPWRTAALALRGAEYLGSFDLPGGSTNYAFAQGDEAVLFIWNDDQNTTEEIYLGDKRRVLAVDLWGRREQVPIDETTRRQVIEVTSIPRILRGCCRPVIEWMLAARFQEHRLPSATGKHPNALVGRNTFPQGISGRATIQVPSEWEIEPSSWEFPLEAGENFSLPMVLSIPANTSLGNAVLTIDFEIDAETRHTFRIHRLIEIGLGDVFMHVIDRRLEDGRVEIEQIIVNRTNPEEVLSFNCSLFARNNRRQKKLVTQLGNGRNQKKYYLPNAETLRGSELWLRAEQVDGRRVLNYRWTVGEHWDLPAEEFQEMLEQLQDEWDKPPRPVR